jgi:hypothetical protein
MNKFQVIVATTAPCLALASQTPRARAADAKSNAVTAGESLRSNSGPGQRRFGELTNAKRLGEVAVPSLDGNCRTTEGSTQEESV